jgi:hypothetical protein
VNLRDLGQRLIPTGERSRLLTRTATTQSVLLCVGKIAEFGENIVTRRFLRYLVGQPLPSEGWQ